MEVNRTDLFVTPFLRLIQVSYEQDGVIKKWYGVTRTNAKLAVVVAALTEKMEIIFVRQPRPLLAAHTVELPAGLMDQAGEQVLDTAERELLEETGYTADNFRLLVGGERGLTVSSGLTDERVCLVLATGARKVCEPLTNEATEPNLVPLSDAFDWLTKLVEDGKEVDYKLFGAIRLLEKEVCDGDQD